MNEIPPLGRLNGSMPRIWADCRWCKGRVRPAIPYGALVCEKCDKPEHGGLASWPEMFR